MKMSFCFYSFHCCRSNSSYFYSYYQNIGICFAGNLLWSFEYYYYRVWTIEIICPNFFLYLFRYCVDVRGLFYFLFASFYLPLYDLYILFLYPSGFVILFFAHIVLFCCYLCFLNSMFFVHYPVLGSGYILWQLNHVFGVGIWSDLCSRLELHLLFVYLSVCLFLYVCLFDRV